MDKKVEQFFSAAKKVHMSADERRASWAAIESAPLMEAAQSVAMTKKEHRLGKKALKSFMKAHPVEREQYSIFDVFNSFFSMRFASAAMAVVILVSASSGAAYAAEDTVPGDLLYPVKINITEPIRGRFARSPEAREKWHGKLLERRLHESDRLQERGEVRAEHFERLQERIELHSTFLEERMESLGDDEQSQQIKKHLERVIEHHEEMLTKIESGELPERMKGMRQRIRRHRDHIRPQVREKIEELKQNGATREEIHEKLVEIREEIREQRGDEPAPSGRLQRDLEGVRKHIRSKSEAKIHFRSTVSTGSSVRIHKEMHIHTGTTIRRGPPPFGGQLGEDDVPHEVRKQLREEFEEFLDEKGIERPERKQEKRRDLRR